MNKKLIEQLQNGEIAVKNDGTLEQIKTVLKCAFPKDCEPDGHHKYYYLNMDYQWDCDDLVDLPKVSVKDFFKDEWKPKFGEKILVSDDKEKWTERVFVAYQKELDFSYIVLGKDCAADEIKKSQMMVVLTCKHAKPFKEETPEYTMEELTEKLGHTFKIKK